MVVATELAQPRRGRGRQGHQGEAAVEHHQAGRLGEVGLGCLCGEQSVPSAFGEHGCGGPRKLDLAALEQRTPLLPVEAEHAPRLPLAGPQGDHELLLAPERLHLLVVLAGELRPAARGVVECAETLGRREHLVHRVEVLLGVLTAQPRGRDLRQPLLEVTGGEP